MRRACDPANTWNNIYKQVIESSMSEPAGPNGSGNRVYVPRFEVTALVKKTDHWYKY